MTEADIARMQGELDAINVRLDRAWEGIKADLARKTWLDSQIIIARNTMERMSRRRSR